MADYCFNWRYRIPAVVQTRQEGVVLAFCEGRKLSSADHGWNDIVMKRSVDNGHTCDHASNPHHSFISGKISELIACDLRGDL